MGPAAFTKVWLVLFWSKVGQTKHNTTGLKCSIFVGRSGRKARRSDQGGGEPRTILAGARWVEVRSGETERIEAEVLIE